MDDNKYLREEVIQFLIDNIPVILDVEKLEFKYDKRSIYYKIYKYIKKLEEGDKNDWWSKRIAR